MSNFKNLKIAITDKTHLKAVCEVLESLGYEMLYPFNFKTKLVLTDSYGNFASFTDSCEYATISDILKMRDDMVKANAKSS